MRGGLMVFCLPPADNSLQQRREIMKIAQMFAPVHALGPGERVALWTQGCHRRCRGCISPEFQPFSVPDMPAEAAAGLVMSVAARHQADRLTISGGDPFDQADELLKLLRILRGHFSDILVYTGYTLEEISQGACGEAGRETLHLIDVLIDGPYVEEENIPECILRGSANQVIHYLSEGRRAEYEAYMREGRKVEVFSHESRVVLVGILNREREEN